MLVRWTCFVSEMGLALPEWFGRAVSLYRSSGDSLKFWPRWLMLSSYTGTQWYENICSSTWFDWQSPEIVLDEGHIWKVQNKIPPLRWGVKALCLLNYLGTVGVQCGLRCGSPFCRRSPLMHNILSGSSLQEKKVPAVNTSISFPEKQKISPSFWLRWNLICLVACVFNSSIALCFQIPLWWVSGSDGTEKRGWISCSGDNHWLPCSIFSWKH